MLKHETPDITGKEHGIILQNRGKLNLTGVKNVYGFTESEIFLYTALGDLTVRGRELQIHSVDTDTGNMLITGQIDCLRYSRGVRHEPRNIITKLFR
jgi:sporulation protein YabP